MQHSEHNLTTRDGPDRNYFIQIHRFPPTLNEATPRVRSNASYVYIRGGRWNPPTAGPSLANLVPALHQREAAWVSPKESREFSWSDPTRHAVLLPHIGQSF
jgi:hypothetical protein